MCDIICFSLFYSDMLCCALFASAVIQFFVQNIRRNEPNQKQRHSRFFSFKFGMFLSWTDLLLSQVGMLFFVCFCAEYFVSACVRKYHLVQLKEYHELCSLSLSRVLALDCTISHQMLQFFYVSSSLFKSNIH